MKTIVLGLVLGLAVLPTGATTLTGINLYGTDSTGATKIDPAYWSTSGGGNGAFVWDGLAWLNQLRDPDLDYILAPGFFGLDAYGDGNPSPNQVAVNLYFNHNVNGAPDLSLLTTPNTGVYDINLSAANTNLTASLDQLSGQLFFDDGVNRVDVLGLWWFNIGVADVVGPDQVGQVVVGPAPIVDSFAHILLEVSPSRMSPVPEPATAALTISGLLGLLLAARKARG